MNRLCKTCKEEKDISCFYERPGPYITKSCKDCICKKQMEYDIGKIPKRQSIEKERERNRRYLYNLTQKEFDKLYDSQDGKCAICRTPEKDLSQILAVDHCHRTGKVRGLLCTACNQALGKFKDNVSIVEDALYYLILNK